MNEDELRDALDSETNHAFHALARLLALMRMSAYVFACYSMVQGFFIVIGGERRFSAPGYATALLLPYAPESWGWVLIACGVFAFIGVKNRMYKLAAYSLGAAGVWSMAFALAFLISSIQYPDANLTAFATYSKDAILFLLLAIGNRVMSRTQELHDGASDAGP